MSKRYTIEHFLKFVKKKANGCWIWTGKLDNNGYGMGESKWLKIKRSHRLSYYFHFGEFDRELDVLHRCDNPSCVNPEHLFLGTQTDNNLDKMNKGRYVMGSDISFAKLDDSKVKKIRNEYSKGVSGSGFLALAKKYKVGATTIRAIINNKMWRHVI